MKLWLYTFDDTKIMKIENLSPCILEFSVCKTINPYNLSLSAYLSKKINIGNLYLYFKTTHWYLSELEPYIEILSLTFYLTETLVFAFSPSPVNHSIKTFRLLESGKYSTPLIGFSTNLPPWICHFLLFLVSKNFLFCLESLGWLDSSYCSPFIIKSV